VKELLNFCVRENGGGYNEWFRSLFVWLLLCLLFVRSSWRQVVDFQRGIKKWTSKSYSIRGMSAAMWLKSSSA